VTCDLVCHGVCRDHLQFRDGRIIAMKLRLLLLKSAVVAALVLCSTGCNPLSPSEIVGDWSGRDVPLHFAYVEIRFQRNGSAVSGTACYIDGDLLEFTGVPVTVDGARVTFTGFPGTPAEQVFAGRFTDHETLKGHGHGTRQRR
jgi:hypothetical protein